MKWMRGTVHKAQDSPGCLAMISLVSICITLSCRRLMYLIKLYSKISYFTQIIANIYPIPYSIILNPIREHLMSSIHLVNSIYFFSKYQGC